MTIQDYWALVRCVEGTEGKDWDYYMLLLPLWELPVTRHQN